MTTMKKIILAVSVLLAACACNRKDAEPAAPVKNVIYIIGDGMGIGQITSMIVEARPEATFVDTPGMSVGLAKTYSANERVTDSSAGGTALACGVKTNNGVDALTPSGDTLTSIMTYAKRAGKVTGILDSSEMFDATPACFYGHVPDRDMWDELALQLPDAGVDILLGSHMEYINDRKDGIDLTPRFLDKGYIVTDRFEDFMALPEFHRILALFETEKMMDMPGAEQDDMLTQATRKTLDMLAGLDKPEGFFLMIESARIDHFGHVNDAAGIVSEMKKFNHTVQAAFDFAKTHEGTLVVVTADHETSGLSVYYDDEYLFAAAGGEKTPHPAGHTGNFVPVFAYGTGASEFDGFMENTEIPHRIAKLAGLPLDNPTE